MSIADKAIFSGLLSAYFFHNLFVFDNLTSYILFFSVLAYFHFLFAERQSAEGAEISGTVSLVSPGFQILLILLVIAVSVVGVYFLNVPPILSNISLIHALEYENFDASKALGFFKETFAYDTFGKAEARLQLLQAANGIIASGNPDALNQGYFLLTKSEMEKQIQEEPFDARYPFFLGQFFDRFGISALALENLEAALKGSRHNFQDQGVHR